MPFVLFGTWLAVLAWASPASAAPLTPDDVVRSALEHDPSYQSAVAGVAVARGELRASTFLRENPTLSGEYSLTSDQAGASVEQPISLTGEGLAARKAAAGRLDAAELEARRAALVTAADARRALAGAIAAEERARIATHALDEATTHRQAIEARVSAGDAAPLDGRLARLEEGRAAEAFVSARREALTGRVALSRFVPDAARAELPDDPLVVAPEPTGGGGKRSDLQAAERRAEAARFEHRAARAATLPAVTVGAFVERDDGGLSAGPNVGLTLPLWHGNPAGVGAADAAEVTAKAEAAALRASISAEQTGSADVRRVADDALARLSVPPAEDGRAALVALADAQARGELDAATATLLRAEVLDAWSASVDLRRAVADARIDALLATEDAALLPSDLREVSR